MTPNLESLDLNGCNQLVEVYTPVGCLKRLVYLNLRGCSRFKSILFMKRLELLESLSLSELHLSVKLDEQFPSFSDNGLPNLWLTFYYREELPSPVGNLQKFVSLDVRPCTQLVTFSGNICGWRHLRKLEIDGSLPEVPKDLAQLQCLVKLRFFSTRITYLPNDICMLKHLKSLKLESCWLLEELPEDLGLLESLEKLHVLSTCIKFLPDSICMSKHLKSLKLGANKLLELPQKLGGLHSLEKLNLSSTSIKELPDSICLLTNLRALEVKSCEHIRTLPKDLGRLKYLEKLHLSYAAIIRLPDSICMLKHLNSLKLKSCGNLKKLPKDLGKLDCLENLVLIECRSLRYIPDSICKMNSLRYLCLPFCSRVEKLPEEIGLLECLEELDVKGTGIWHLPKRLSLLKGLRIIGSRTLLQSSGFATDIQNLEGETFCEILL